MKIVNFSHPITAEQEAQLRSILCGEWIEIVDIRVQISFGGSISDQAEELVNAAGLLPEDWPLVVVRLPELSSAAAAVLAEIRKQSGVLPWIVTTRPAEATMLRKYDIWEVIDLN